MCKLNIVTRYLFALLISIHGLIHLMGFAKAFGFGNFSQLTKSISKTSGICWLSTCLLFAAACIGLLLKKDWWPFLAIAAVVISQVLIFSTWSDAKFGTIANAIILLFTIAFGGTQHFEGLFIADVKKTIEASKKTETVLLTEADIASLPKTVQKYLRFSGVLNQPKVNNVRIEMEGEMRSKTQDWFPFKVVQYDFFDDPARFFFMKGKMFGIIVPGYHHYQHATAAMEVKLFGLIPVMEASGAALTKAETVTLLNDMCLMAPATLIDKRIVWEAIDTSSAKATFSNKDIKISATLHFNETGQLVNFISDDRMDITDRKQYRFSTPVKEYEPTTGGNRIRFGEAVWHYPDGDFVYGKFIIKRIEYNVSEFKQ